MLLKMSFSSLNRPNIDNSQGIGASLSVLLFGSRICTAYCGNLVIVPVDNLLNSCSPNWVHAVNIHVSRPDVVLLHPAGNTVTGQLFIICLGHLHEWVVL